MMNRTAEQGIRYWLHVKTGEERIVFDGLPDGSSLYVNPDYQHGTDGVRICFKEQDRYFRPSKVLDDPDARATIENVFAAYGLTVASTWSDFVDVCEAHQPIRQAAE